MNQLVVYPISSQFNSKSRYEKIFEILKKKGTSCKKDIEEFIDFLTNPIRQDSFDSPDKHTSSSIINQPLWQASLAFDKSVVQKSYLEALVVLKNYDYKKLARILIEITSDSDSKLSDFLEKAYGDLGLIQEH